MASPKNHRLFKQYPLEETVSLSIGVVPVPYHIYDGYGIFIGGTADFDSVRTLLRPEQVEPIQNEEGRALMGIWLCNFRQASLGPHHELQFSVFIQRDAVPPVSVHPLGLLVAMLKRQDMQMLCHGLYNSTAEVVAYNRELLSLNAHLTNSRIERHDHHIEFSCLDAKTQKPLLEGIFKDIDRPSLRASFDFVGQLGLMETFKTGRLPWIRMEIVNPIGVVLTQNRVAKAYTKNDVNVIQYFNSERHSLHFGDTPYAQLDFKPQVIQYMDGFKFVYLNPE